MIRSVLGSRASIGGVLGSGRGGGGNGLLTGLVAYWGLDEASGNALDKHSGGLTLTQANSPGADTGKVYATARVTSNAATQYFYRSSETALQTGNVDFAFAVWCYPTDTSGTARRVAAKRNGTHNDFEIVTVNGTGTDNAQFLVGASGFVQSGNGELPRNAWSLILCWHNAADDTIGIQINNGTPTTASYALGGQAGTAEFRIGNTVVLTGRIFIGRIGPVAFWKNRTLDATARAALWNDGAGLAYSAFG